MGLVSLSGMTGMGREKERKVLSDALSRATNVGRTFQREKNTETETGQKTHKAKYLDIYIFFASGLAQDSNFILCSGTQGRLNCET